MIVCACCAWRLVWVSKGTTPRRVARVVQLVGRPPRAGPRGCRWGRGGGEGSAGGRVYRVAEVAVRPLRCVGEVRRGARARQARRQPPAHEARLAWVPRRGTRCGVASPMSRKWPAPHSHQEEGEGSKEEKKRLRLCQGNGRLLASASPTPLGPLLPFLCPSVHLQHRPGCFLTFLSAIRIKAFQKTKKNIKASTSTCRCQ